MTLKMVEWPFCGLNFHYYEVALRLWLGSTVFLLNYCELSLFTTLHIGVSGRQMAGKKAFSLLPKIFVDLT